MTRRSFVAFLVALLAGCETAHIVLRDTSQGNQWVWPYFLDGKPTVLAFWDTEEMQCLRDVPAMNTLEANSGTVQFVTVAGGRDRAEINDWIIGRRGDRIKYVVLLDLGGELRRELEVNGVPTFIYFDVHGNEITRANDIRTVHHWFTKERWMKRAGIYDLRGK